MRRVPVVAAFAVALATVASGANAREIDPNTLEISGATNGLFRSMNESYSFDPNDTDSTIVDARTSLRYYVARNLGVGIYWAHSRSKFREASQPTVEYTSNVIGPMAAYHLSLSHSSNLYLAGYVGRFSDEATADGFTVYDYAGFGWGAGGGVLQFLSHDIALSFALQYSKAELDETVLNATINQTAIDATIGLSAYF